MKEKRTIEPRRARIAVYAVAVAFELGMPRAYLKLVRSLAESGDPPSSDDDPSTSEFIEFVSSYVDWEDETTSEDFDVWSSKQAENNSDEWLQALSKVRQIVQPMNGTDHG